MPEKINVFCFKTKCDYFMWLQDSVLCLQPMQIQIQCNLNEKGYLGCLTHGRLVLIIWYLAVLLWREGGVVSTPRSTYMGKVYSWILCGYSWLNNYRSF